MPLSPDFLEAQKHLSNRFLRAPAKEGVARPSRTLSIVVAAAAVGRNIHSVGVGSKIVDGKDTQEPSIRVYVVHKLPVSLLSIDRLVPKSIGGIPTDVIETPQAFLGGDPPVAPVCSDQRMIMQRPVIAGISTGHRDITAGTLSYFCRSTHAGDLPAQVYVLSTITCTPT